MKNFDAIIIGTGQAGPSLAARFAAAGRAVAIIERHKFGGPPCGAEMRVIAYSLHGFDSFERPDQQALRIVGHHTDLRTHY